MKGKKRYDIVIPVVVLVLVILLQLTGLYETPENLIYDVFLRIKPPVPEDPSILLLNIDDLAITKVGVYPWPRDIIADGLILLREFDAEYAVFDIEYTEKSPRGINPDILHKGIPDKVDREFSSLKANIKGLLDAIASGAIEPQAVSLYTEDILGLTDSAEKSLLSDVQRVERDNDVYLGEAAAFFGNSIFTIGMLPSEDENVPDQLREYCVQHNALQHITLKQGTRIESAVDIRPTILPILKNSLDAGFTNVEVDKDGVRRRINLLMEYHGKYFPQLSFSALLHILGHPDISVNRNSIILAGARLPGGETKTMKIPFTSDRYFFINWPKKEFEESFRQLSFYYLVLHSLQEEAFISNLRAMAEAGFLDYYEGAVPLLEQYKEAETLRSSMLAGKQKGSVNRYRELRNTFFSEAGTYLESGIDDLLIRHIDTILSENDFPPDTAAEYRGIQDDIKTFFPASLDIYRNLMKTRDIIGREVPNSICIIGWTGTSTTDRGVTPFDESYDNVGTHASIINTVLQGKFLDDLPWWYSAIEALLLTTVLYFIIRRLSPGLSILLGAVFIVIVIAGALIVFLTTGNYIKVMNPFLAVTLTFISLTVLKFLSTAKERTFIRDAFGHYLSLDVINELMDHPEKLTLGGEKKYITAVFTDVQGFSTISEQLTPAELVKLLNIYLSAMSDIILDMGGTIDKFEGDAIIAFFGAPLSFEDHAARACSAAVKMKKAEAELNKRFISEKLSPNPLLTRIGINTGDMVVGNMGTGRKMDYTIMGNAVNLAARLEGVNKQYGTWILVSETTYKEGGKEFPARGLDRVRVVGIHEPVRLYTIETEAETDDGKITDAVNLFRKGIECFETRQWDEAVSWFGKVMQIFPEDGPSKTFTERCMKYKTDPPPDEWDGVFNLTMK